MNCGAKPAPQRQPFYNGKETLSANSTKGSPTEGLFPFRATIDYMEEHKLEYAAWEDVKARCTDKNHVKYKMIGAKGIKYDEKWEDFDAFFADMGPAPGVRFEIGRKDKTKDYSKDNCIWRRAFPMPFGKTLDPNKLGKK